MFSFPFLSVVLLLSAAARSQAEPDVEEALKLRPWRLSGAGQAAKPHLPDLAGTPLASPTPNRADFPPPITRVHLPLVRRADAPSSRPMRSIRFGTRSPTLGAGTSVLAVPVASPAAPILATAPVASVAPVPAAADPPSSLVTTGLITASATKDSTPDAQAAVSTEGLTSTVVVIATPTEPTEVVVEVTSTAEPLQSPSLQTLSSAGAGLGVEGWMAVSFGLVGAAVLLC